MFIANDMLYLRHMIRAEKIMLSLIVTIISLGCVGCDSDFAPSKDFYDVVQESEAENTAVFVLATSTSLKNAGSLRCFRRYARRYKGVDCYVCDLSSIDYFFVKEMLSIGESPVLLKVENGRIVETFERGESGNLNAVYNADEDKSGYSYLIRAYLKILNENSDTLRQDETLFAGAEAIVDSFAYKYVEYRLAKKETNDLKEMLLSAVSTYDGKKDVGMFPLFLEMSRALASIVGKDDKIVFPRLEIHMGAVRRNADTLVFVPYVNVCDSVACIYNVAVSCSCLDVDWNRIVPGYGVDSIGVRYRGGEKLGPFYKSLYILSDNAKPTIISIDGDIV